MDLAGNGDEGSGHGDRRQRRLALGSDGGVDAGAGLELQFQPQQAVAIVAVFHQTALNGLHATGLKRRGHGRGVRLQPHVEGAQGGQDRQNRKQQEAARAVETAEACEQRERRASPRGLARGDSAKARGDYSSCEGEERQYKRVAHGPIGGVAGAARVSLLTGLNHRRA